MASQPVQPVNLAYLRNQQRFPPTKAYDAEAKLSNKPLNFPDSNRNGSPPLASINNQFLKNHHPSSANTLRSDTHVQYLKGTTETSKPMSPASLALQKNIPIQTSNSPVEGAKRSPARQKVSYSGIYDGGSLAAPHPSFMNAPKGISPPLPSLDSPLVVSSTQVDSEREVQAKAKRLLRFNVELSQPMRKLQDLVKHKPLGKKHGATVDPRSVNGCPADETQASASGGTLAEYGGSDSSDAVIGLCPDMCPESEREERERKGDLDKYERLNGERNQTTQYLAVKKYNRTAERDADLIRPLPVLQKTIDYLLDMLDQPYSDNFLGIYNFLWDRMRAIRMDLRMQHIFNQDAITMLEQMIRLHIIAMHELCEYEKGEGFSEGFDAHLNIEQMNKTSVELFQIYDDHRKKGKSMETEKEFRGYYALLKLDRHPGYKVEPAELSLDLAKMAPEVRCSPEIMFARNVARACRTGNYIAFFRLAKQATYLQACLMHAHFAKTRTQALASLHIGLQNNQGIPVQHIVKWLGMEGEDIEALLEYHGFVLRKYEEMYMVKVGLFRNSDNDFPTKCSELVRQKRSHGVIDDVYSGPSISCLREDREFAPNIVSMMDQGATSSLEALPATVEDEMPDFEAESIEVVTSELDEEAATVVSGEHEGDMVEATFSEASFIPVDPFARNLMPVEYDLVDEPIEDSPGEGMTEEMSMPKFEENIIQNGAIGRSNSNYVKESENSEHEIASDSKSEMVASKPTHQQKEKLSNEKLKNILRKWKQQALVQRDTRERKLFLARVALSSLSLGPPIRFSQPQPNHATGSLDIDQAARNRFSRLSKSLSRLNVSELVAATLSARNPYAKCICWKLVVYIQGNVLENHTYDLASKWLLSKLRGNNMEEDDDELIVSSSNLSIWKKWIDSQISPQQTCCLSVIRETIIGNGMPSSEDDIVSGMSCAMFLVSKAIPYETQRNRLHNLVQSLPPGSSLPLLIVCIDIQKDEASDSPLVLIQRLGLQDVDKTKINFFSIIFLAGDHSQEQLNCFFEDDNLRDGLQWLAEHSPLQPALRLVNIRELVANYLKCSLEVIENIDSSKVGPEHCVLAFNEAIARSAEEILAAASINPTHWPCPEINLLDKSSTEQIATQLFLPNIDWNSASRIQSLVHKLEECRLPSFPDISFWLNQGYPLPQQIQEHKLALEECLVRYLTQSCHLLTEDLATVEANVMLQKGVGLELHGSSYHIVPRWIAVFRRIYNWQLMKLANLRLSDAYILDRPCGIDSPSRSGVAALPGLTLRILDENSSFEVEDASHSLSTKPTFDEMFGVICDKPLVQQPVSTSSEGVPVVFGEAADLSLTSNKDMDVDIGRNSLLSEVSPTKRDKQEVAPSPAKTPDKLAVLLQQCRQVQDKIDEKLALYF
ncbi:SAC3/GANP/THP3 protein [Dioscorea alata]|nr:SAC3/GANP/THP3 protein [Dioscorea alata]